MSELEVRGREGGGEGGNGWVRGFFRLAKRLANTEAFRSCRHCMEGLEELQSKAFRPSSEAVWGWHRHYLGDRPYANASLWRMPGRPLWDAVCRDVRGGGLPPSGCNEEEGRREREDRA